MSPFFGRSDYQVLSERSTAPTKQLSSTLSSKWAEKTSVRVTAVDAIVNVNALFTVAVFIGLSIGTPDTSSSNSCVASATDVRRLFVYEVVSFSFFLFSSLTAQGLKLALNLLNGHLLTEASKANIHLSVLKAGIVVSAFGSVMGANTELPTGTTTASAPPPPSSSSPSSSTTSVHVTALDAIVNVNSLFTVAVFIGLSFSSPAGSSTGSCNATNDDVRKLVVFEVVSFSCFLFSSLVAQGLKLSINLLNSKDVQDAAKAHINFKMLRFGMIGSAVGSVLGYSVVRFDILKEAGTLSNNGQRLPLLTRRVFSDEQLKDSGNN
ncbi:hypothetical protein RJ639_035987 [Escallonia herrerae]|uniref:Uncharacterized protein n=1 Tax=Escallonia herrerae TaxID=1293975 RepID=A0AA88X3U0_9ASTE|nr:hypothetical protein RJ639_035987 [Escallonia herrerae]